MQEHKWAFERDVIPRESTSVFFLSLGVKLPILGPLILPRVGTSLGFGILDRPSCDRVGTVQWSTVSLGRYMHVK